MTRPPHQGVLSNGETPSGNAGLEKREGEDPNVGKVRSAFDLGERQQDRVARMLFKCP
jgi:hypothetical protein